MAKTSSIAEAGRSFGYCCTASQVYKNHIRGQGCDAGRFLGGLFFLSLLVSDLHGALAQVGSADFEMRKIGWRKDIQTGSIPVQR